MEGYLNGDNMEHIIIALLVVSAVLVGCFGVYAFEMQDKTFHSWSPRAQEYNFWLYSGIISAVVFAALCVTASFVLIA